MAVQTIYLEHIPSQHPIHIALFKDVGNSAFLKQQLLSGNKEFEYSFIDASVIAESFRRFGISDTTTSLLVIKVSTSPSITHESVTQHLEAVVEGTPIEFSDNTLSKMTDMSRIRKIYKLNTSQNMSSGKRMDASGNGVDYARLDERKELETVIIGTIALRGAS
ncbi:hypothetical protein FGG08_002140 [Glutinoglossum americanum]|uniref:EKC/KEOPS complex subunit CGI121 n=1 Tax=Glutinoglossum americanum TaxID=1670608 RepID=A0A9P8I9V3_9PEZI|nr:hypothetical protein FGG08_002140 [Glutinoglossum americanum]